MHTVVYQAGFQPLLDVLQKQLPYIVKEHIHFILIYILHTYIYERSAHKNVLAKLFVKVMKIAKPVLLLWSL